MTPVSAMLASPAPLGADAPHVESCPWHVVHTKARQEKALAEALSAMGIDHYLPLVRRRSFRGRRPVEIEVPLFASYLFLRGEREDVWRAAGTKRIAQVIPVADQPRIERELDQVRLALAEGADLAHCDYLRVGRRVRVVAGPFRGLEGLVEDRARADRLVLQVEALGRATSLEIDAGLLEPAD